MHRDSQRSDVLVEIGNDGVVDLAVWCVCLNVLDPPAPCNAQPWVTSSWAAGCRLQHGRPYSMVWTPRWTAAPLQAAVHKHRTRCGSQWCLMTAPAPSRHALQTPAAVSPLHPAPLCTPAKRTSTICARMQHMLIHRPPGHQAAARTEHAREQIMALWRTGVKSCGWLNSMAQLPSMCVWKLQQVAQMHSVLSVCFACEQHHVSR